MGELNLDGSSKHSSKHAREEKKKSKKSKSDKTKSDKTKIKKSSKKKTEVEEDSDAWDPKQFDKQTGERWKGHNEPNRVHDLPSPSVADVPPDQRQRNDDEEWPFKKEHAIDEKRKSKVKKSSKKDKALSVPRREEDEDEKSRKSKKSKKKSKKKKSKSEDVPVSDEEEEIVPLKDEDPIDDDTSKISDRWDNSVKQETEESVNNTGSSYQSSEESDDISYFSDEDDESIYSYDLDGSVHTQELLDDDDLDYDERQPYYHTPGMLDYDMELMELMAKANPELTDHLNRRINRRNGKVQYDANMPMFTRQALMTRQASVQVRRRRVDADSVERGNLGFRNDSFHSTNGVRKPQRRGPNGRRAPPRSKSSGLGTMALAEGDDARARFRSRGASTSFQRYNNKPNRVGPPGRERRESDELSRSQRGNARGEPNRGNVLRSKSTTALGRPISTEASALKPERRIRRQVSSDESSDVESDEDSDVMTSDDDEGLDAPKVRRGKRPGTEKPKPVNKRDMTIKRHRRKLHAIVFKTKMEVDMQELFDEVQRGEIPKSPIKSLLMDEP